MRIFNFVLETFLYIGKLITSKSDLLSQTRDWIVEKINFLLVAIPGLCQNINKITPSPHLIDCHHQCYDFRVL